MLTAILFAITMAPPAMPLHCVVTAEDVDKPNAVIDYKGVRYITCCGGCKAPFMKDPETVLKSEKTKGVLIGESLFDVTTGLRIEAKKAKAFEDFGGVRYYFATEKGKAEFDIDPKKATAHRKRNSSSAPSWATPSRPSPIAADTSTKAASDSTPAAPTAWTS
jgi:YHS domain-containing protein